MEELLQSVRDLKTKAKNRRDLGLRGYPSAIATLEQAIAQLLREFEATSRHGWRSQLASELADCYGILGGIRRRWGLELEPMDHQQRLEQLAASIEAYDRGYRLESDEEFEILASYNLVNRLVIRIFYDPRALSDPSAAVSPPGVEALDVRKELQDAEVILGKQVSLERRGDVWALADLALVELLLDNRRDAMSIYAAFNAASPPAYAYDSALSTLKELSALDLPKAERLRNATRLLENWLDRTRR
jgi:Tetratricopeptide Repeats-Sensor